MPGQYKLDVPLLVIGISLKLDSGYKPFTSVSALMAFCKENKITPTATVFSIYEITPSKAIAVPTEGYSCKKSVGYIADCEGSILEGVTFTFTNQYPKAVFNEDPPFNKYFWTLTSDDNVDWCKMIANAKIPYRYETLDTALTELTRHKETKNLINNIIGSVARRWKHYAIFKRKHNEISDYSRYLVIYRDQNES